LEQDKLDRSTRYLEMEKVNLMPERANLQGDQIVTCIELQYFLAGMVQLQTCGHPKAHQKISDPLTTTKLTSKHHLT
jgi:flagellar biosynthesis regulator FlbT